MRRYFHVWKFDPSFSREGMSYSRVEACLPYEAELVDTDEADGRSRLGLAWEMEVGFDILFQ